MLQVYVDDSKSSLGDREYVLAGYIAHVETWAGFIESWNFVLSQPPSIKHLHTVDAHACNGEFGGWSREKRNSKLLDLATTVQYYKLLSFSVTLKQKDFDKYFSKIAPYNMKDPYFICFWAAVIGLARFVKDQGEKTSISFVFDEHGEIGSRTAQWFEVIKTSLEPELQQVLKITPIFQNDELVVPLQAADALAWHIRRGNEPRDEQLPAKDRFLGRFHLPIEIDEKRLERLSKQMNAVPGIERVQTKNQWRKIKKTIAASMASGEDPIAPKLSFVSKVKNYVISYIRFRYLIKKK